MQKAFIFDFDATLVDSKDVIYKCFEKITMIIAPERVGEIKKIIIGPPLEETAKEILGSEYLDKVNTFTKMFIQLHDQNVTNFSKPFPKVIETLKKLHSSNIPMAIATNKREIPTYELINHYGWFDFFRFIECSNSNNNKRNKTEMISEIIKKNALFANASLVGDTKGDGLSAQKNNIPFIYAAYGYGKETKWDKIEMYKSINKFDEILNETEINI